MFLGLRKLLSYFSGYLITAARNTQHHQDIYTPDLKVEETQTNN